MKTKLSARGADSKSNEEWNNRRQGNKGNDTLNETKGVYNVEEVSCKPKKLPADTSISLCPAVQSLSEDYSFDNIYKIGAIRGATLQKEYERERVKKERLEFCGDERPQRKVLCQLPKGHKGSCQAVIFWEREQEEKKK